MKAQGSVHKYGDNIDTDVIIPARYLNSFDPKELAAKCMIDVDREPGGISAAVLPGNMRRLLLRQPGLAV